MSDIAIRIESLSKQYRLGTVGTGTLHDDLNRWWHRVRGKEDPYLKIGETNDRAHRGSSEYVWALRDINLEVKQGEVLGIIGKNGAGKSTLLKILSKVTGPTTGRIMAKGRIASLLEVGTGFHRELTGRENIYLNGAILGMTKAEVSKKLDEIIDFAGVERYLDTPVKRYSSGMTVRLGFAVAAFLEEEILIVDEVLAVGDAEFQKKAIGKMQEVSSGGGRTVLFVSHNMAAVKELCGNAILLGNGEIQFQGTSAEVIKEYLKNEDWTDFSAEIEIPELLESELFFKKISISDAGGIKRSSFSPEEEITIAILFETRNALKNSRIVLTLLNKEGSVIFASTNHNIMELGIEKGIFLTKCHIPANLLNEGVYSVKVHAGIPGVLRLIEPKTYIKFQVISGFGHGSRYQEEWPGFIAPKLEWNLKKIPFHQYNSV